MQRSLFRSMFVVLAGLAVAAVSQAVAAVTGVRCIAVRAWDYGASFCARLLLRAAEPFKVEAKNLPGPLVVLLRAKQYLLRQIKRQRPVVFPAWNMSPST